MSANSPYQSRLFSWLNRQSIRIKDRFGKTIRQAKVTTLWSIQVLLYPIYLAVQAGRVVVRGLGEKVKSRILLQLSSTPKADQSLNQVLDLIQPWLDVPPLTVDLGAIDQTEVEANTQLNQSNTAMVRLPKLRGVACAIATKHLVLVDVQNQVWDVLSLKQQQQIENRIVDELARYWRKQRLVLESQQPWIRPLPLISVNPHTLPPILWFWQLMAWIQTREVAVAINLFGEANWVCPVKYIPLPILPEEEDIRLAFSEPEIKLSTSLNSDRRLIESADEYALIDDYIQSDNSIKSLIRAAADYFKSKSSLSGKNWSSSVDTQTSFGSGDVSNQTANTTNILDTNIINRRSVQSRRRGEKSKFNQSRRGNLFSSLTNNKKKLKKSQRHSQLETKTNSIALPSQAKNSSPSVDQLSQRLKQLVQSPLPSSDLSNSNIVDTQITPSVPNSPKSAASATNEYIETVATPVGYSKNPLKKLIAWLDRQLLKLEKAIARILYKLIR